MTEIISQVADLWYQMPDDLDVEGDTTNAIASRRGLRSLHDRVRGGLRWHPARPLAGALVAVALVLVVTPRSVAQTITMGESVVLSSSDGASRNRLVAQRAALAQMATLQSLSFYVSRASGQVYLGVYDATGPGGGPGAKKAETGVFTPGQGWNTRSVTVPVALPEGNYWLAYTASSSRLNLRRRSSGSARSYSRTFGPLPATFSTSTSSDSEHWSFYATLNISAAPPAPTLSLNANPTSVTSGGVSTLTWSSTNATSCTASNVGAEGSTWSGPKPTSGSDLRGPLTGTATYSLACSGPGGTASKSATITVGPPPAPTVNLTANPMSITPGQSTTLAWSTTNASSCNATGGWSGGKPLSGELIVLTASTATYTLTCTGAGGSAAKSVTVTVTGGVGQLTLTWVDNAGGTATFKVERKTGTGGTYGQIASTGPGATSYVDTTPLTGTTYCYRVRAVNTYGDSNYSNEACRAP
jgi:hypothetical protein